MTREAGEKLLALAGKTVDELLAAAEKPGFTPIPLGIRIRGHLPFEDPRAGHPQRGRHGARQRPRFEGEVVIFSAHWDHLGIATPVNGDAIYNGAIDNATRLRHPAGTGARLGGAAAKSPNGRRCSSR